MEIKYTIFTVSVRTFAIPFYYGFGSAKGKFTVPTVQVLVPQHYWCDSSLECTVVQRTSRHAQRIVAQGIPTEIQTGYRRQAR
jgi:hypothetical protein